jgi:NADPH:quinone reductase-like Zn-dependent oxidoreductase
VSSTKSRSTFTMSNRAAFLETAKGQFVVRHAEIAEPGEGEVLVKVCITVLKYIPSADDEGSRLRHTTRRCKCAKLSMIPVEYPAVLGSPVAGVVETIGAGVSKVAVGDRVVCGTKIFSHKKAKYGGLQRFCVVDESEIIEVSI